MGQLGTQVEYAEHLGCTPPYVTKLKAQGRLRMVETPEGPRVDFEASDALLAASRDPGKDGVRERWARERMQQATAGPNAEGVLVETSPADAPSGGQSEVSRQLYEERLRGQIRYEQAKASVAELELLERAGDLVKVSDAEEAMARHGRAVNQAVLMTLVPRLGQLLAPHVSEEQLQALRAGMESEAKVVLNELASRVAAESGTASEARQLEAA